MRLIKYLLVSILAFALQGFSQDTAQPPSATQPHSTHSKSSKSGKKGGTHAAGTQLTESCANPSFPGSATADDTACGSAGSGGREAAQNTQKNNFCAAAPAEPIDFNKLSQLQTQVANNHSINWGDQGTATNRGGPTTNRAPLAQMGEGKLVVLKAFVLKARQEGKESVNCGPAVPDQPLYHDIHISLVPTANETDECKSVVAEMIPHHRLPEWTADNVNKVAAKHLPVRVTGQLFFDSSHVPCQNDREVRSNPRRISLWEAHPIYKFEVCTGNCDAEGTWVDLADWLKSNP